jgi:hypothetical protein
MHAQRRIVTAGLLALVLFVPNLARAASCITTVAGDTCLAQCIGNLVPNAQQMCGSDPACHQAVSAAIAAAFQALTSAPAGTPLCAAAVANAKATCGCP